MVPLLLSSDARWRLQRITRTATRSCRTQKRALHVYSPGVAARGTCRQCVVARRCCRRRYCSAAVAAAFCIDDPLDQSSIYLYWFSTYIIYLDANDPFKWHSQCAPYGAAKQLLSALHRRRTALYGAVRRCTAPHGAESLWL